MPAAKSKSFSARAGRVWQRLREWYGARLGEQYGETPPPDWCEVVDRSDNDCVRRALSIIRQNYVEHPPTFPQFEKAFTPPATGFAEQGPTMQERLCAYVMKTYGIAEKGGRLTPRQVRGPWQYTYKRQQWVDNVGRNRDEMTVCTGVIVPPDGESHAIRVTVEDMERAQEAA